jgi:6-phospho-beta-glucosidase
MTHACKVVVLGGSAVATPGLSEAITRIPGRTRPIQLVLVGRDRQKLDMVAHATRMLAGDDPLISVAACSDAAEALEGAEIVINQIRVGGLEARAFDESFSHDLGLPGEETVGPGGFANASRTIPVVLEYGRIMERVCPEAALLTFANPSSVVQCALAHYTGLYTVGMCDGPVHLIAAIAQGLNTPPDRLDVDYVGMHHYGWVVGIRRDGKDMLPEALAAAAQIAPDIEPAITRTIGAIPGPYHNYFFHPDRMLAKKAGKRTRAEELLELQDEILEDYAHAQATGERPAALAKRKARWYDAIVAPVLLAFAESAVDGTRGWPFILNVTNREAVPWLPPEAIVEAPVLVQHGRARPLAASDAPQDVKALVQRNCAYEMLAVEAIVERDRDKAARALLLNPMGITYDQAVTIVERAWAHG